MYCLLALAEVVAVAVRLEPGLLALAVLAAVVLASGSLCLRALRFLLHTLLALFLLESAPVVLLARA
jgi:hypothetical protein